MVEILTPEEFAARLRIGRSTLFDWLQKGLLRPGRLFFKQGRTLRFFWSEETPQLVAELLASSQEFPGNAPARRLKKPVVAKPIINWKY